MLEIKNHKDPVLHKKAELVSESEFGEKLDDYMSQMLVLCYAKGGVGLAAPQIGDSRALLVADLGYVSGDSEYGTDSIKMVNPVIVSYSEETVEAEEGCLSFPGLVVKVKRPVAIHVKFFSPAGEEQERTFTDWQARIISHEIDHLQKTTLYSRASNLSKQRYDKKIRGK